MKMELSNPMDEKELIELEADIELDLRLGMLHQNWAGQIQFLISEIRRQKIQIEGMAMEVHRLQPPIMDGGGYDLRNTPI